MIIGAGNGLSPVWRQAITWFNVDPLLFGPLGTNSSGIKMQLFFYKEIVFENCDNFAQALICWQPVDYKHISNSN